MHSAPIRLQDVFLDAAAILGIETSAEQIVNAADSFQLSPIDLERIKDAADGLFNETQFGITPRQYAVTFRMIGVRRELQAASPKSNIANIANDWGFSHLGRFSVDYKRMFGERPSDTLSS